MRKILCLIDTDDKNYYFCHAIKRLSEEFPGEISGDCFLPVQVRADKNNYEEFMKKAKECDFAVIYFHSGCGTLTQFHEVWESIVSHAPCFYMCAMPEEVTELMSTSSLSSDHYRKMNEYFSRANEKNCYNMLKYAAFKLFGIGEEPESYEEILSVGLFVNGKILNEEEESAYMKQALETDKTIVGLLLHKSYIQNGNYMGQMALTEMVENKGAFPIPIFSSLSPEKGNPKSGVTYAMETFFQYKGKILPKVIIATAGFCLTNMCYPEGSNGEFRSSMFEKWNVPIIHTATTRYSKEEYQNNSQGFDPVSLPSYVFQPEMDGQIITVPFVLSEIKNYHGIQRRMWEPMEDRIEKIVTLALKYAKLSLKKNHEKKLAIIFHNMPGNHNIGRGVGLDTFASVYKLLLRLKEENYQMDTLYKNGQDLADSLLSSLTNDMEWISSEEAVRRSVAHITTEQLHNWYDKFSEERKAAMEEFWGKLPGNVMVEQEKMLIPGLLNGNIFIGLQPSRALGEQAERLYHDAVFPPPYSYMGYYRWIEDIWGADAIIHVGTHGSVEWLPGKEVGLSKNCYPDICMGTLPNFYIYHIGITGEGIQAKRRSAATIIDHMPPSMDDAGVYEHLEDLDGALKEYYMATFANPGQVPFVEKRIGDLAEKSNLLQDLQIDRTDYDRKPTENIEKIHLWVEELKNSVINDGLHIFGEVPPQGNLYENMLRMLVRVKNGSIISLNDAILTAMGYDAEFINDHPGAMMNGKAASSIHDEAVKAAKMLMHDLTEVNYQSNSLEMIIQRYDFSGNRTQLKEVLLFLCDCVKPKLDATTDEMDNLIRGLNGEFIEPGLGGNPTRGNVELLPTGRNFYAGDPSEIPSRSAWEIGKKLAAQSLEHYMRERGEYPESVAIVIWATNVLKTSGEDFGEIFSFMGVRPVYLGNTSKVIGVEAIDIKELGHPRIDVTLRISGLFRDMYPNLVELMDAAVSCVAALDESEEENYIKKHIHEDVSTLLEEGMDAKEALDQAYLRVFGCPCGGYGAGVSDVIASKNWKDYKDLAAIYENWSGNAYGRSYHGKPLKNIFKRRLSTVGMTIKNECTVEIDMLSSDDFYSFHGGLIACVKANSGKTPISITGHSDDPDKPIIRDTAKETARIMRSRILNPKWLEGLKRHGFKGAQEISKSVDSFFGWDASADVAEDWMYEDIAKRFLFDKETRKWMEDVNAGVIYDIAEKLLEANQRGMWNADKETISKLQKIYLNTEGLLEEMSVAE